MKSFKQKIRDRCFVLLEEKINSFQTILSELEEGTKNDSKSSAGDKHETARAMMQLEQEKIGRQLREALQYKNQLEKLATVAANVEIINGSLVKTNNGYLFLGVSLGKVLVDETPILVISPQSPLGTKLIGLKQGDKIGMNLVNYLIETIE